MSLKKNSRGFTLIELMIVVAIIGILAAVAIPKFADLVTKSKEATVKGSLGAVRSALSIYYGDTEGVYPTTDVFAALTTNNKYMPAVANVSSLGRFVIPPVTATGNTGHSGGMFASVSANTGVLYDGAGIVDAVEAANVVLAYGAGANTLGEVYMNCSHEDTKSARWTTY